MIFRGSFLAKYLLKSNQVKYNQIANKTVFPINELKTLLLKKENPKNENPNEIIKTVEKIIDFSKEQNCKGLKILTTKKLLQRLPIATNCNCTNKTRQYI